MVGTRKHAQSIPKRWYRDWPIRALVWLLCLPSGPARAGWLGRRMQDWYTPTGRVDQVVFSLLSHVGDDYFGQSFSGPVRRGIYRNCTLRDPESRDGVCCLNCTIEITDVAKWTEDPPRKMKVGWCLFLEKSSDEPWVHHDVFKYAGTDLVQTAVLT